MNGAWPLQSASSPQSRHFVLFSIRSSGFHLGYTVAAVSALRPVEHVKNPLQNIITEGMTHIVPTYLCLVGLRPSPEVDAAVGVGRQRHRVPRRVPVLAGFPDLKERASERRTQHNFGTILCGDDTGLTILMLGTTKFCGKLLGYFQMHFIFIVPWDNVVLVGPSTLQKMWK